MALLISRSVCNNISNLGELSTVWMTVSSNVALSCLTKVPIEGYLMTVHHVCVTYLRALHQTRIVIAGSGSPV